MRRQHVIEELIRKHKPKVAVELGVWKAVVYDHITGTFPEVEYWGVDTYAPFVNDTGEQYTSGENNHPWDHEAYFQNVQRIQADRPNAKFLRMHTVEAASKFEDKSVDFIFIDAGHSYECVKADIEAWLPKMKPGGVMTGHDYCSMFPGVKKATTEIFGKGVVEILPATIWLKNI